MKKNLRKEIAFLLICVFIGLLNSSRVIGTEKTGILCFEMGAEVAYYFIKGKVIRYSAFHAFNPPTELQKTLYGKYVVDGNIISWRDKKTKVRFTYDKESKALAANENWNTASVCETIEFSAIKRYFEPILEKNRASLR